MKVSAITTTCGRPCAMRLCEKYVARQTVTPDQWIVADGGATPADLIMGQTHILTPGPAGAENFARNVSSGISAATGDVIVFFEDDDHYAANHIEVCLRHLEHADAVGCGTLRYYNLEHRKWCVMPNVGSALCNTAFKRELIPQMQSAVNAARRAGRYNIDGRFWQGMRAGIHSDATVIGMKGLPGTAGLGMGHRPGAGWHPDPNGTKLREWIGGDADNYIF